MSSIQESLGFISESTIPTEPIKWLMVTNQRNLFFMLGAGLIMPPAGFGKKYYEDPLLSFPGWIPVFLNQVPKPAISVSVKEKDHLIACVLEISLRSLSGPVKAVQMNGDVEDIDFPKGVTGREAFLLLPAPLPVTFIESVTVETREEKIICEKDASDFDNVDFSSLAIKVLKSAFTRSTNVPWPPHLQINIAERSVPLERPASAGGALAMLAHLSNIGNLAISASRLAFDHGEIEDDLSAYRIIAASGSWFESQQSTNGYSASAQQFWDLVDRLIESRSQSGSLAAMDVVLVGLKESSEKLDANARDGIERLSSDLKGLLGLGEYSITELLERHTKPLPRALILFFLKESCSELLEFRHELLTEYDYISAAILFGIRDRWLGLPIPLRKIPGLRNAGCHRMAVMSHRLVGSSLKFGEPPSRPMSLRELLRDKLWSKKQNEAALVLARKCGWNCISTRVSLGKGSYILEVDSGGMHLILEGEPKAVQSEAIYDCVLKHLAEMPVSEKIEFDVRKLLTGTSS